MMNKRKLWVSILACVMAAAMVLSLLLSLIPRANAASSSEIKSQINALEDEKAAIQEQMDELQQKQIDNLAEIQGILDQKNNIDQQIGLLNAEIANINEQISTYNLLIADKQDELDEALARLESLQEKNKERIRTMEEDGKLSYWSVLFKASSFADLLDRLNMIEEIAAADQRRLQELNEAAEAVANAREELAAEKASLESTKAELDASEAELNEKRAEADALISELLARGDELDALMGEYESKEEELLQDIAAREEEYNRAKQREYEQSLSTTTPSNNNDSSNDNSDNDDDDDDDDGSYVVGSNWMVPCSYVYVSSPFSSERLHPTLGYVRPHNGIDLAAYQGTPIYASRGGTVTTATYGSESGYYVVINHGDGYSSCYLHMTHYVVKSGQTVSQGQVIGYVGSTGASTGPHLHFGIMRNGSYVNPANYIAF